MINALADASRSEGSARLTLERIDEARRAVTPIAKSELNTEGGAAEEDAQAAVLRLVRFLEHQSSNNEKKPRAQKNKAPKGEILAALKERALQAYVAQIRALDGTHEKSHLVEIRI